MKLEMTIDEARALKGSFTEVLKKTASILELPKGAKVSIMKHGGKLTIIFPSKLALTQGLMV